MIVGSRRGDLTAARRVAGSDITQRTASGRSPAPTLRSRTDEKYGPRCLCGIPTCVSILISDNVLFVVAFTESHPLAHYIWLYQSGQLLKWSLNWIERVIMLKVYDKRYN